MGDAEKGGADSRKKGEGEEVKKSVQAGNSNSVGLNLQPPTVT